MQFVLGGYVCLRPQTKKSTKRCFDLMQQYRDLPMDFADATLVALAEELRTPKIFTLDFKDFSIYRYAKGHRIFPLEIVGLERFQ